MIDSLVINSGPEIRSRLAGRKWAQRLAGLAYSSDDKVRYSVLQLFSNWSGTYRSGSHTLLVHLTILDPIMKTLESLQLH